MDNPIRMFKDPRGNETAGLVRKVRSAKEEWNSYTLDDGSVIQVKFVLTEALRIEGQFDANGDPMYVLQGSSIVKVTPAPDLRKKV